jgi:hypothetical protein
MPGKNGVAQTLTEVDRLMARRRQWFEEGSKIFGKDGQFDPQSDDCKKALEAIGVTIGQINATSQATTWKSLYTLPQPVLARLRNVAGSLDNISFWQSAGDNRRFDPNPESRVVDIFYNPLLPIQSRSAMLGTMLEEIIHSVSPTFDDKYLADRLGFVLPETGVTDMIGVTLGTKCF